MGRDDLEEKKAFEKSVFEMREGLLHMHERQADRGGTLFTPGWNVIHSDNARTNATQPMYWRHESFSFHHVFCSIILVSTIYSV